MILSFFDIRVAEVFLAKTRPFSLWQQRATGIIVGGAFVVRGATEQVVRCRTIVLVLANAK